jgi:molecular chaperone GrpE
MTTDPTPETGATPETPANEQASEQALLDQLRADLDRFRDLAMRSAADLENYRKRASREKEDAVKYANAAFLERLVPILDNFELGLTAAKAEKGAAAIVAGLEMVARQLQDFLTACGVEPVNADPGTPFDPNVHEAIGQHEHAEIAEGGVIQQMRRGFKLRDRLLRPATVLVSKGKAS